MWGCIEQTNKVIEKNGESERVWGRELEREWEMVCVCERERELERENEKGCVCERVIESEIEGTRWKASF